MITYLKHLTLIVTILIIVATSGIAENKRQNIIDINNNITKTWSVSNDQ